MRSTAALSLLLLLAPAGCAPPGEVGALDEAAAGAGCAPGARQPAPDGCNTCTCTPEGDWRCGALACAAPCAPGAVQSLPDGCNTCTCTPDGTWACTAGGCEAPPVDREPERAACGDGDVQPGDCGGICWCAEGEWRCDLDCEGLRPGGAGGEGSDPSDDEVDLGTGPSAGVCSVDAECAPSGCGGRVCGLALAPAECPVEAPAAACYVGPEAVAGCGCQAGRCGWSDLEALAACAADEAP